MFKRIIMISAIMIGSVMFLVAGCKKSPKPQPSGSEPVTNRKMTEISQQTETAKKQIQEAADEITQQNCPVMGGKINKDIFVEHNGRKVYFCCQACVDTFKNDPEKYLPNVK